MNWRILLTTFGIIFLAEMGDKTQLAAMTMAAETKQPWMVFIGASLALTCVSALGIAVGAIISNYLPLEWIKRIAAFSFILIGILVLSGKFITGVNTLFEYRRERVRNEKISLASAGTFHNSSCWLQHESDCCNCAIAHSGSSSGSDDHST
jgi:Ca2+/H+ antiporter, TMEM165/GDT1 family